MSRIEEVTESQASQDLGMSESESSQDCISEAAPKETKETTRNESDKDIAAVQIDVEINKDCRAGIVNECAVPESENTGLEAKKIEEAIPKEQEGSSEEKTEYVKSNSELAVDSNKVSTSVSSSESNVRFQLQSLTLIALENPFDAESVDSSKLNQDKNNGKDESANILFDDTEFLKTYPKQSRTSVKMFASGMLGCVEFGPEDVVEIPSATNKSEKEISSAIGPPDLVIEHPSRLFSKCEEPDLETEHNTANLEGGVQTCTIEEKPKDESKLIEALSSLRSQEQDSQLYGNKEEMRVLEVHAPYFIGKRIEPVVTVEQGIFRISFDVSSFDKESISCRVVGNKLDVYARVSRQNDYGSEMHEMHQIFKIPQHVDKEIFTAYIKDDLLFVDAPVKHIST